MADSNDSNKTLSEILQTLKEQKKFQSFQQDHLVKIEKAHKETIQAASKIAIATKESSKKSDGLFGSLQKLFSKSGNKEAEFEKAQAEKIKAKETKKQTIFLEQIVNGISGLGESMNNLANSLKEKAKGGLGMVIAGLIAPIVIIVNFFKQLSAEFRFLKKLTGGGLKKIFAPLKNFLNSEKGIGKFFGDFAKKMNPKNWKWVQSLNPKNWKWVQSIQTFFAESKSFQKISKTFKSVKESLGKAVKWVLKIVDPMVDFFKSILGIGKTAGETVGKAGKIMKWASSFGKTLGKIFLPITFLMSAFDFITGFMAGYKEDGIMGGLKGGLTELFKGLLGFPLDLLTRGVSWIFEKFGWTSLSKKMDSWTEEGGFSGLIEKFIGGFFDAIKSVVEWVKDLFKDPLGTLKETWNQLLGGVASIGEWLGQMYGKVAEWFGTLFENPMIKIEETWNNLLGGVASIGEWLKKTLISPIGDWFSKTFSFDSFKKILASAVKLIFMPVEIIKSKLLNPAADWLGKIFGFDSSEFTDFSVMNEAEKMWGKVKKWFGEIFTFDFSKIKMPDLDLTEGIKGLVRGMLDALSLIPGIGKLIEKTDLFKWANAKPKPKPKSPSISNAQIKEGLSDGKTFRDDSYFDKGASYQQWSQSEEGKGYLKKYFGGKGFGPGKGKKAYAAWKEGKPAKATPVKSKEGKPAKATPVKSGGGSAIRKINPKSLGIDWDFISKKEGGAQLKGYVPDPEGSKSGVTIATGFDLGARSLKDISGLSPELQAKLAPYLGKQKYEAQAALQANPLTITKEEAKQIDRISKAKAVSKLQNEWNKYAEKTGGKRFEELSSSQQTVAASVAFQYGSLSKTPNFRKAMQSGNWTQAVNELNNFGDSYSTRRKSEAMYLQASLDPSMRMQNLNSLQNDNMNLKTLKGQQAPVMVNAPKTINNNGGGTNLVMPKNAQHDKMIVYSTEA